MLKIIRFILSPLTIVYKHIIDIRNKLFDKGILKEEFINAKVVAVGNLTVGGSGKTPLVISIVKHLRERSIKVGVLSRGYGRKTKGYKLVSDGNNILMNVQDSGDEIYLVSGECKVPAAAAEKRVVGAKNFIKDVNVDVIVLDDAFQHRWIGRDFNVLIIDQRFLSNVNSFDQRLLPLGSMREPFSSIKRADAVVINKKFSPKITVPMRVRKYLDGKEVFFCHYKVAGIFDVKTNKEYSTKDFEGQNSLVVCGIAKPFSFLRVLNLNNININNQLIFVDHKNYSNKEVQEIRKKFYDTNSYSVLTTHKDAVKLMEFSKELDDIDIYYLKIEIEFEEPEQFFNLLDKTI